VRREQSVQVNWNEIWNYAEAIVGGASDALRSLGEDILHPLDRIVFPITDLIS
jgi:hypothetical protein